jgi:hypothetical protein
MISESGAKIFPYVLTGKSNRVGFPCISCSHVIEKSLRKG